MLKERGKKENGKIYREIRDKKIKYKKTTIFLLRIGLSMGDIKERKHTIQ